jgi:pilus assembly protein CpaC
MTILNFQHKIQQFFMSFLIVFFISTPFLSFNVQAAPEMETSDVLVNDSSAGIIEAFAGKAKTLKISKAVKRVAVGDPRILDFILISPTQLYVTGKTVGSTNIILWYQDGSSKTFNTQVSLDIEPLKLAVARDMPEESDIVVNSAAGSIVLSGSVANSVAASTLVSLAESYLKRMSVSGDAGGASQPVASGTSGSGQNNNIINLIKIRDPQQVMLQVKFAEVNKEVEEKLGAQFRSNRAGATGQSTKWAILSNGSSSENYGGTLPSITGSAFLSLLLGDRSAATQLGISAEKVDGLSKILAEPTILAMSGQQGSFLSGGTIFIPVPSGGATNTISLQEKEFGIGLTFLPTVLDKGRINLKVTPEVSELGSGTVAKIGTSSETSFPSFTKSRVSTTVQLNEGETLVIGGLLSDKLIETITATPGLGELPIFGALFRSTSYQKRKSELLVVVTPTLVKADKTTPLLPTDSIVAPSRFELFMMNRLEGSAKN